MTKKEILLSLSSLTIFRNLLKKDIMRAFVSFLESEDLHKSIYNYGEFVSMLAPYNMSFSEFLRQSLIEDENCYIKAVAAKKQLSDSAKSNLNWELKILSSLTALDKASLWADSDYEGYIPEFENTVTDLTEFYTNRLENVEKCGYGIFALHGMFRVENDKIVPVEVADGISVDCFVGYESQRQTVIGNTKALTEGRPAQNILLCGDAGTGKSSTVKACANMFFDEGVRLIELRKDQLFNLSYVMGAIAENPLKFIIFIDDLSFNKNDDCFSMLKAVLEGSAESRSSNAVIYATSNRRHIVKESFADRTGTDDVHRNDTMQELLSLSDRFGLTVYYQKPNKALYLQIVSDLAKRYNVTMDENELGIKAEAFALSKGSRSPRAAEQFIKSLL